MQELDQVTNVSVADISAAVAHGLSLALERRGLSDILADKILIYGGRLEFNIQIAPQLSRSVGVVNEVQTLANS